MLQYHSAYPHGGGNYAMFGLDNDIAEDIYQFVTIPANAPAANLTFWVNVVTQETIGEGAYDYLEVHIFDSTGTWIAQVGEVTNEDASKSNNTYGNYFKVGPIDLSAYKGTSIFVMFWVSNDAILPTTFLLDDVSLLTNAPTGSGLYVFTPCRLIDTRNPAGPAGGPRLEAGQTRTVAARGNCGIPTDATAIAVNVTVPAPAAGGYLTTFPGPAGAARPFASTLNFMQGLTRANNAIITLGADGSLNVYNGSPAPIDFIIDVNGYFK